MGRIVRLSGPWEYFVRKVRFGPPSECWPWLGALNTTGYGKWTYSGFNGKVPLIASRVSFELFNGWAPPQVNHRCNNRWCCNPDHLYAGTQKENMKDRACAGTHHVMFGSKQPTAKLTESQVLEIRARNTAGELGYRLAEEYGVSKATISLIVSRKNWAWLD